MRTRTIVTGVSAALMFFGVPLLTTVATGQWPARTASTRAASRPATAPAFVRPKAVRSADDQCTAWVAECLKQTADIKPGMTRKQLLEVYTTEGGLSTRLWRRYVWRHCPYIKVDVKFKPLDEQLLLEHPADIIVSISKPYLEWTVAD